ncbi:MAG: M23 family metallopeptidase [Candidatus Dadabacteria bacterium]|nr:MAG: M23 family metallopeptidase [Candidatus Dadabacteria bacterium]
MVKRPLALAVALLAGCGTPFGIYHEVRPGQTLYRIARTYGVDPAKLQRLNRIQDPTRIRPGDMIFVPGADRTREVPTMPTGGKRTATTTRSTQPPPKGSSGARERVEIASRPKATSTPKSTWSGGDAPKLIWPVPKGEVSSGFGQRDGAPHDGVDIRAPEGSPVLAAADGRVIYSGDGLKGYGNLIIVRHQGSWATVYAHNKENLVNKGDFVVQGQKIATVGQTGRASGPHLHFEVRFGKAPKNPLQYLAQRSTSSGS